MTERVFEKNLKWPKNFFLKKKASEASILNIIDLLITNLVIFCQLEASFQNKMAEM